MINFYPLTPDKAALMSVHGASVGWNLTENYIRTMIQYGFGYYLMDDETHTVAASGMAAIYDGQRAWIGTVVTNPAYQGQGLARRMMNRLIDELRAQGIREIMLDASDLGKPLYDKMGFRALYTLQRWLVQVETFHAVPIPTIRPFQAEDLPAIVRLDAQVFGAARPQVYETFTQAPHRIWVDAPRGEVQGWIVAQQWKPDLIMLGSWVHENTIQARRLFLTALSQIQQLGVSVIVPDVNLASVGIVQNLGFQAVSGCTRMILGENPHHQVSAYYGSVTFGLG